MAAGAVGAGRARVERRALQVAVSVGGLVPVGAGLAGALAGGAAFTRAATPAGLDSHVRYLSGLLLAIGIGFWSTVGAIERRGARFRLLAAIVVTGGLARGLGVLLGGVLPAPMIGGLAMELAVTPALALWQARVERTWRSRP